MEKLSANLKEALKLLAQHGTLLVSSQQPLGGRSLARAAIASSTARALKKRGLAEIRAMSGRPDRDRGVNKGEVYAFITELGKLEARYL